MTAIGEAIQQKKFKNEYQKMLINIIYTSNWLEANHAKNLKPFGISSQQFNLLRILRGQHPKPASVNLLIERMLDKNSNASRLVEKLRLKQYVERTVCPDDRRAVNVIITKKGLQLLEELDKKETTFLKNLDSLNEKEAEKLNELLDKLRSN
jgi:DNA-binding MarR family transcriptional regulator